MEQEAIAKDRMVLRPKAKVKAFNVSPAVQAPQQAAANGIVYKFRTPPGPPPAESLAPPPSTNYVPPKLMVVDIAESKDVFPILDESREQHTDPGTAYHYLMELIGGTR